MPDPPYRWAPDGHVLEQLERILSSAEFNRSQRLGRLLRFIVEAELNGDAAGLKESVIGREVYDRGDDFDGRIDPIVRTEFRRLRRKLDEYYSNAHASDLVIIRVPKGGYRAVFTSPERPAHRMYGEKVGRYEVLERLDSGTAGDTYRVRFNNQDFALRLLPPDVTGNPELAGRLRTDLFAAGLLEHSNICRTFGLEEEDGQAFSVSRYCEGVSLEDRGPDGGIVWTERLAAASQILDAMSAAHTAGVAHGNLTAADVLLIGPAQGTPRVKILNFGMQALRGRTELSGSGQLRGRAEFVIGQDDFEDDARSVATILWDVLEPGAAPKYLRDRVEEFLGRSALARTCIQQQDVFRRLVSDTASHAGDASGIPRGLSATIWLTLVLALVAIVAVLARMV